MHAVSHASVAALSAHVAVRQAQNASSLAAKGLGPQPNPRLPVMTDFAPETAAHWLTIDIRMKEQT